LSRYCIRYCWSTLEFGSGAKRK